MGYIEWGKYFIMIDFQEKFLKMLYAGIFLLSACVIGTCVSSISKFNDITDLQYGVLLVPNILSYALIVIGALGYLDLFKLISNKRKS